MSRSEKGVDPVVLLSVLVEAPPKPQTPNPKRPKAPYGTLGVSRNVAQRNGQTNSAFELLERRDWRRQSGTAHERRATLHHIFEYDPIRIHTPNTRRRVAETVQCAHTLPRSSSLELLKRRDWRRQSGTAHERRATLHVHRF